MDVITDNDWELRLSLQDLVDAIASKSYTKICDVFAH